MKAARYYGRRDVRIEEVPVPEPDRGEYLIEVEWCGICGTDLHEFLAGMEIPRGSAVVWKNGNQ